jgi:hypothetical protein
MELKYYIVLVAFSIVVNNKANTNLALGKTKNCWYKCWLELSLWQYFGMPFLWKFCR